MQELQSSVLLICLTALGLTLAEGLLPNHRFEKQIRLITAALLLTVMLKPLAGIRFSGFSASLCESEAEKAELTALAEQAENHAVCESIRSALNRELALRDIPCEVTAVTAHISEDGSIVISEVQLNGNLLTGSICLKEWLGPDIRITEGGV
ncbi:MAG: hypothetical protein IKH27_09445 [Oscillospiraceae bacterium]|nr:hypothetical protein [Oscillospiraceae bacterium]